MEKEFIRGTVYLIRQELNKEVIEQDIKNIRECGFNIVTIWPCLHWDIKNKKPDYSLVDFVVDRFARDGIKIIAELMGQYCAMEYAPDWMVKPDFRIKDRDGHRYKINVHDLNFNHPEVRRMISNYIEEVVNHFKDKENLYGYDIYNEHHFESFDEYTLKEFRQWLKGKYHTIEELNHIWSCTYSSFDEVDLEYRFWHSIKSAVDWEMFKYDNLAGNLRMWVRKLKQVDSTRPVIADNELAMIIYDKRDTKFVDDWKTAREVDYCGTTWYPKSGNHNEVWLWSLMFDFFRSAVKGKEYLLSELQTNNYSTVRNRGVTLPEDIRIWIWRALGFEVKGVTFWKWAPFIKAQQLAGRGLVGIDRKISPRALAAQKANAVIKKYEDAFLNSKIIEYPVCIYYSAENKKFVDTLVNLGNKKDIEHIADISIYGWYKALYELGIHPVFVNEDELLNDILSQYRVFIIPFNYIIDNKIADKIKLFINNGGTAIAETRLGLSSSNELLYLSVPGCGLDKVFGFKETGLYPLKERYIQSQGEKIKAGYFSQSVEPYEETEIYGVYTDNNEPGILRNKTGKGMTYYFTSSAGQSYYDNQNKGFLTILKSIIKEHVIDPYPLRIKNNTDGIDNILHKSGSMYILFSYNFQKIKVSEQVELFLNSKVTRILEILSDCEVPFKSHKNKVSFKVELSSYTNKIFFIYMN